MPSAWNMFVKKIYEEGRKTNGKTYKFSQALKDASKRKGEMAVDSGKKVSSKTRKVKSKKEKCIKKCEDNDDEDEHAHHTDSHSNKKHKKKTSSSKSKSKSKSKKRKRKRKKRSPNSKKK